MVLQIAVEVEVDVVQSASMRLPIQVTEEQELIVLFLDRR
jgi:hypothetical protein